MYAKELSSGFFSFFLSVCLLTVARLHLVDKMEITY